MLKLKIRDLLTCWRCGAGITPEPFDISLSKEWLTLICKTCGLRLASGKGYQQLLATYKENFEPRKAYWATIPRKNWPKC